MPAQILHDKATCKVLVIVDVQAGMVSGQDPDLLQRIAKAAAEYQGHVVCIGGDGLGVPSVDLPAETPLLWKDRNDGGDIVYAWLVGKGFVKRGLIVEFCGMNTNACVRDTATGLGSRLREEVGLTRCVRVVLSLCADDNGTMEFVQDLLPA